MSTANGAEGDRAIRQDIERLRLLVETQLALRRVRETARAKQGMKVVKSK